MSNVLRREKQEAVIRCLINGSSVRATERIADVHRDTILRLLVRVGGNCERLLDRTMRRLTCRRLQVDEIWAMLVRNRGT